MPNINPPAPEGKAPLMSVAIGSTVEVIHRSETQKISRRTVGVLLEASDREVVLSLRPVFGTTSIPIEWVILATQVPDSTPVTVNELVR
jgi:hypothetical protein